MTRSILTLLLFGCSFLLVSCLETEERIEIKNDNSGTYSMTMDLGNILKLAKEMGQGKEDNDKIPDKKDSTLYFKPYVDTATALTAEEKALIREGSLRMKIDEEENDLKFTINIPFKKMQDVPKLRQTYMSALDKLGVMDKMKGKKDGDDENAEEQIPAELSGATKNINPAQNSYTMSAAPGKLSYKFTDKKLYNEQMNDSTMQMMKSMSAMMGDMTFKTVFVLPKAAKKFKGNESEISDDKKTVTFKSTLADFMEKPESMEYDIEY